MGDGAPSVQSSVPVLNVAPAQPLLVHATALVDTQELCAKLVSLSWSHDVT